MSGRHAVIAAHRTKYPIVIVCFARSVSCAGYNAAQGCTLSRRAIADAQRVVTITTTFTRWHRCYRAPRINRAQRAAGTRISAKGAGA